MLAMRAALLKSDGENFCRSAASEIVERCNGDRLLIPDISQFLLEFWEKFLDRYSKEIEFKIKKVDLN